MPTATSTVPQRLAGLRRLMSERGLDLYLVPSGDPHQSEYVPSCWQRRPWISGFTGSAGSALVFAKEAQLWTDSRYFLQAEAELAGTGFDLVRSGQPGQPELQDWLGTSLVEGATLGVDPQVLSLETERKMRKAVAKRGGRLELVEGNLVDQLWGDRPGRGLARLEPLAVRFSGEAPAAKLARVREAMAKEKATALVVTTLDAVAWLFDVRGSDVDYNPVAIAYAIVEPQSASLFADPEKVSDELRRHLPADVRIERYDAFEEALDRVGQPGALTWVEPATCSAWVGNRLTRGGAKLHEARSPITTLKARKNATEVTGARAAHVRDGVALVRFLSWMETAVPAGGVTEVSAADRLEALRAEGEHFKGLSFPTISGFGDHGAVVHYRPSAATDKAVDGSSLYLVDSGAQYLDGTTDVTRTTCYGNPTAEQRDCFTRVLRGHVALARATFPAGTTGKHLDALARLPLWDVGLNYGHGTGHGVGAYLNVHEGPQSIRPKGEDVALEPGMIVSNEPGYYAAGSFGVRIESLVVVEERKGHGKSGEEFLGFETLTMCPIDRRLVDVAQLHAQERAWLDAYHERVRTTLSPLVDGTTRAWLERATQPL